MWNNRFRICWLQIRVERGRNIHFTLPIMFYAFEELVDCVVDILDIACIFVPKDALPLPHTISVHAARELLQGISRLLDNLTGAGPYDLVEVEADHVRVSVKFR